MPKQPKLQRASQVGHQSHQTQRWYRLYLQWGTVQFIIPAESRTAAVNSLIASWQSQGVVGGTAPFTYSWTTTGGSGLTPTNQNQTGLSDGS